MPATYNFQIRKGSTFTRRWRYLVNDVPYDLSGKGFRMQIRETVESDVVLLELLHTNPVTEPHIVIEDQIANPGYFQWVIPSTITEPLTWEEGGYDCEMFDVGSNPEVVIKLQTGRVEVLPEFTR